MNRTAYEEYLKKFNARDYDGLLTYFADEFEVTFAGYSLRSRQAVKSFYSFIHQYCSESIVVDHYISTDRMIAMEARVKLEGIHEMPPNAAKDAGFERLMMPPVGVKVEIPQFIHYHLNEQGKFVKAFCAVFEPGR
jgi:SnoaL-like domain